MQHLTSVIQTNNLRSCRITKSEFKMIYKIFVTIAAVLIASCNTSTLPEAKNITILPIPEEPTILPIPLPTSNQVHVPQCEATTNQGNNVEAPVSTMNR